MIKVGLDVATKKSGIAVFWNDNYFWSDVILSESKNDFFSEKTNEAIGLIWKGLKEIKMPQDENTAIIIVETSIIYEKGKSGISAKTSEKLSIFTGIYIALLKLFLASKGFTKIGLKMVAPTTWQNSLGWSQMKREERKLKSIVRANQIQKFKEIKSDDEADAINIADIGLKNELKDFWSISHYKREFRKKSISLNEKIQKSKSFIRKYEMIEKQKAKEGRKLVKAEREMLDKHRQLLQNLEIEKLRMKGGDNNEWPNLQAG